MNPEKTPKPLGLAPAKPDRVVLLVGWYTASEWRKAKESSVDADKLEPSHAEWLAMAEEAFADLQAAGLQVQKYHIRTDELLAWCLAQGRINDSAARAAFVSAQGARASGGAG